MDRSHWSDSWIGAVIDFVGYYLIKLLISIGRLIPVLRAPMENSANSIIAFLSYLGSKRLDSDTMHTAPNRVRLVTIFVIAISLIVVLILIGINVVVSLIIGVITYFFITMIWKENTE